MLIANRIQKGAAMSGERKFQELLNRRFAFGRSLCIELNDKTIPPDSVYESRDGSGTTKAHYLRSVRETRHFVGAYKINYTSFDKKDLRMLI